MVLEKAKCKGYHPHYDVARLEEKNGQWQYEGKKIALQEKIEEILRENHNHKLAGHPGIKATLLRIRGKLDMGRNQKGCKTVRPKLPEMPKETRRRSIRDS